MCGDDGVSSADFSEYVCCEYQSIVSKHHPERWKHELHHGTPNFRERLKFVLEHHKILEKEELIKLIDHGDQGFY